MGLPGVAEEQHADWARFRLNLGFGRSENNQHEGADKCGNQGKGKSSHSMFLCVGNGDLSYKGRHLGWIACESVWRLDPPRRTPGKPLNPEPNGERKERKGDDQIGIKEQSR